MVGKKEANFLLRYLRYLHVVSNNLFACGLFLSEFFFFFLCSFLSFAVIELISSQ